MSDGNRIQFLNKLRSQLMKGMNAMGNFSVERVKQSIDVDFPPPSEEGNPPHYRTGDLSESIGYTVRANGMYDVVLTVGSGEEYAVYLEYGTEKMGARPFLRPEMERLKKEIPLLVRKYLTSSGR